MRSLLMLTTPARPAWGTHAPRPAPRYPSLTKASSRAGEDRAQQPSDCVGLVAALLWHAAEHRSWLLAEAGGLWEVSNSPATGCGCVQGMSAGAGTPSAV